jgi:hypothetical protein
VTAAFYEEGKAEGERLMLQVALEGRFGQLPEDMVAALRTADEATLQGVAAHLSAETVEQVRARLGLR